MTAMINNIINFLTMSWLTGPIFDKELRVSSRRKRHYAVRFAYIVLLTVAMVLIWLEEVRYGNSGRVAYRVSRMARAGMYIVIAIAWFQFVATQIVAGVMLSTAISDELYHKTLGTLMTTPISSFQVVMGKLLSKLLQTLLLIGISFPLLSIVRVFGGIPWSYVVSSLCITMVTVIFVGSLSLFFSIFTRKAYVSLILTILTLAAIFLLTPFMVLLIKEFANLHISDREFFSVFNHINPYITMAVSTALMANPRSMTGYYYNFPLACGTILAASILLNALSVALVRRVALRQATGQTGIFSARPKKRKKTSKENQHDLNTNESSIRRVGRLPVLWKETCSPFYGRHKVLFFIAIALSLLILAVVYAFAADKNALDDKDFHAVMLTVYFSIAFLFIIILPANCIASEKESRSWHLLLATTLSSRRIVFGKFIGSMKRCLPAMGYIFAHLVIFTIAGLIHPLGILHILIITFGTCALLVGSGILFSTLFKRTTTAVIMNFIFAAVLWAGIFFLVVIIDGISRSLNWDDFIECYANIIPFIQVIVAMDISGTDYLSNGYWPTGKMSPLASTMFLLACSSVYTATGIFFAWCAKKRFRKKIF